MSTCPNNEQLLSWIQTPEILDNEDVSRIKSHVSSCTACQSLLGFLSSESVDEQLNPPPKKFSNLDLQLESESSAYWPQPQTKVDTVSLDRTSTAQPDDDDDGEGWNEFPELDGFIVERKIGIGGFSSVFLAWDINLSRHVAIKILEKNQNNPRNRHRFLREARTMTSLESEFVVEVYQVAESKSGEPFIVMEYIAGETLDSWLNHSGPCKSGGSNFRKLVRLISQAAEGLATAHQAGMIHRDIKPGNILIYEKDEVQCTKLVDFGLALKHIANNGPVTLTKSAEVVGTPAFMAPEQVVENGEIDHRCDIYSLGATLYYGLTGELLFNGSTVSIIRRIIDSQPTEPRSFNSEIPEELEAICLTAIAKDPNHRYQSAEAFAADLSNFADGKPIEPPRKNIVRSFFSWGQSK